MKIPKDKRVVLSEDCDFTTSALVDFLNNKFGTKESGKRFRIGDLQHYVKRGCLPKQYGGQKIEIFENEAIGIKLIRVHF